MTETTLDARGLSCPLPVLKANRALRTMPEGARLRVLTTDRASITDFQVFCRETGHALVAFTDQNGIYAFTIKRRTESPNSPQAERS
jgi:TusA-related sulfurtransferase